MSEEKMLVLLRQGKISKWFRYRAGSCFRGTALALRSDEYILPMHRNLGVFTVCDGDFGRLFAQYRVRSQDLPRQGQIVSFWKRPGKEYPAV